MSFKNENQTHGHQGLGTKRNCETNFRLVRLLTTNPAAALPAIFSPSGKYEQRKIRMLPREHRIIQQPHTGIYPIPMSHDILPTPDGQFVFSLLPLLPDKSYPSLFATEEEIEKKGSCSDDAGYFDFEAILPIDCQVKLD